MAADTHYLPAGLPAPAPNGVDDGFWEAARRHEIAVQRFDSCGHMQFPPEEINDDNKVSATPVDKVFEHGFYPLQGGFRLQPGDQPFEVFDQWIEVLPTDQVVPVEVAYDPKTGRQI